MLEVKDLALTVLFSSHLLSCNWNNPSLPLYAFVLINPINLVDQLSAKRASLCKSATGVANTYCSLSLFVATFNTYASM
jgi:hypothetical protein